MFATRKIKINVLFICLLLLNAIGTFLWTPPAMAYSKLEKTIPEKGAVLDTPPTQVELWYKQPVDVLPATSIVTHQDGQTVQEPATGDPKNKRRVIIPLQSQVKPGVYTVKNKVVAQDGDILSETFQFEVKKPESEESAKKEHRLDESSLQNVVSTSPRDASVVSASPAEVRLTFTDPVTVEYVSIFDNRNRKYSTGRVKTDPKDPRQVILQPRKPLGPGTYGVEWKVKNPDEKESKGQIYFAVQTLSPPPITIGVEAIDQLSFETFMDWLTFLGMSISLGGTFFVVFIARSKEVQARWRFWVNPIYCLVATATLTLFFLRKTALLEISVEELAALRIGWIPLVQSIVFWLIFAIPYRWALLLNGAMLALNALIGHSYFAEYGSWMAIIIDILHLFAISIWLGGLFALLVMAPKEGKWSWFKEKSTEFSRWAFISIVLMILTGIMMTLDYVPTWDDFIHSVWGASVLIKVAVVVVIMLLAYVQMRYMKKGTERGTSSFMRLAKVEIWLGVLALLVASMLTSLEPRASQGGVPVKATQQGMTTYATVSPFVSGYNDVDIRFENAPAFKEVYVRFSEPSKYNAINRAFDLGNGRYRVVGNQVRSPDLTSIYVEAVTQDGRRIVFPFPPRG